MGVRLDGPADRDVTSEDMTVLRTVHDAYVAAVDMMRDQAHTELAAVLGLPIGRVKTLWWTTGCT